MKAQSHKASMKKESFSPISLVNINAKKKNPGMHKKHHSSQPSKINTRHAGMVHYMKIHQSNSSYKQTERKKIT